MSSKIQFILCNKYIYENALFLDDSKLLVDSVNKKLEDCPRSSLI